MADLATLNHWPPDAMDKMYLGELMNWWDKAIDRLPKEEK